MEQISPTQNYGQDPLKVRCSNKYKSEYVQDFVEKWDDLIDWQLRAKNEDDFYKKIFKEYNTKKILNVATGTGFHSIQLLKARFDVVSADGNPNMLTKALHNALKHDLCLKTVQTDWRSLNSNINEKFDAIICLGNSFTHLFTEEE